MARMVDKLDELKNKLALRNVRARTMLVLGAHADLIKSEENMEAWDAVVQAENWEQGMNASLGVGLSECFELDEVAGVGDGALVLLLDQPLVSTCDLEGMLEQGLAQCEIVCTQYADSVGVPVFFPVSELVALRDFRSESGGAKAFILRKPHAVVRVVGAEHDVDTPADLEALTLNLKRLDSTSD
jgi:CTP:molybdopterin cytidylyltransferase MocA